MSPTASPPLNIILLMTDQHRADHVGYAPDSRIATPAIDRLAGSVGFLNAVTANPICTPARAALLTGKYSHQVGMLAMSGDLSLEHPTYPRALQQAGYWTAGVGKFHWLQNWPWGTRRGGGHNLVALRPRIREFGFDHVWEAAGKQLAVHNYCDYGAYLREKGLLEPYRDHVRAQGPNSMEPGVTRFAGDPWPFDEEDYVDRVIGREIRHAIDARDRTRPFFLFGSFCGPHKPYDPPASCLDAIPPADDDPFVPGAPLEPAVRARLLRLRRAYKGMIRAIDTEVGLILDKLERDGLLDSTVILFTADHGEMLGDRGRMSKMQPWRQSVVVPTAIRHPRHLRGARCTAPVELTDLTATILDIAGLDPRAALSKPWPAFHDRVPCRSLLPIVQGEAESAREAAFSECMGRWQLLQSDRWTYIRWTDDPDRPCREALYDLGADPDQLRDVADTAEGRAVLPDFRARREHLMDRTPPAQLGWAPYLAQHEPA